MLEPEDIPESAIAAFERATGLAVCLHDLARTFTAYLPPQRFSHGSPMCHAAKTVRHQACMDFDMVHVRREIAALPAGRVKVCHAGLVEWVVPVSSGSRLDWVLFAGQRRPRGRLSTHPTVMVDPAPALRSSPLSALIAGLPTVDGDEAEWILELLRQLAARLKAWRDDRPTGTTTAAPGDVGGSRRHAIRGFLYSRHLRPLTLAELAAHLGLSEDRAGHLVREEFGESFITLLAGMRLRSAAGLLRHSNLALREIAANCGFGDLSHFHQVFRKRFHTTPGRYRRQAEVERGAEPAADP